MNFSQTLAQILSSYNSTYDAAQEISLQTGETLGTIHKRLSQWLKKDPETWVKINQTLAALGYKLEIKKMQETNEIMVIIQKFDKHGDRTPVVFLNVEDGMKRWEEIKKEYEEDEDREYYDCELWEGEPHQLFFRERLQGNLV